MKIGDLVIYRDYYGIIRHAPGGANSDMYSAYTVFLGNGLEVVDDQSELTPVMGAKLVTMNFAELLK